MSYFRDTFLNYIFRNKKKAARKSSLFKEGIYEKRNRRFCSNKLSKYFCVSERVIREAVDSAFALKYLDSFLRKIYQVMTCYIVKVDKEDLNLLMIGLIFHHLYFLMLKQDTV